MKKKVSYKKKYKKANFMHSFGEYLKRFFVVVFLLFTMGVVIQQQSPYQSFDTPQSLQFVLRGTPSDWGVDESLVNTHGSAGEWDYLFEGSSSDEKPFGGSMTTSDQTVSQGDDSDISNIPDDSYQVDDGLDSIVDFDEVSQVLSSGKIDSSNNYTGSMNDANIVIANDGKVSVVSGNSVVVSGDVSSGEKTIIIGQPKSCIAPWGEKVEHGDFVLAYQQRTDVEDICNVEKRLCVKGTLKGSYIQSSCKQGGYYSYEKVDPIANNNPPVDSLIQPQEPINAGAEFDKYGKINATLKPLDTWPEGKNTSSPKYQVYTQQESLPNKSCVTPWGESVKDGHLVKAYRSPIGLLDLPCDVEIRLCVGGKLKGSFAYGSCEFKNMTYRDYMVANIDQNQANPSDLINTIDNDETQAKRSSQSFWKWLGDLF